jgi:hypothetical protein
MVRTENPDYYIHLGYDKEHNVVAVDWSGLFSVLERDKMLKNNNSQIKKKDITKLLRKAIKFMEGKK